MLEDKIRDSFTPQQIDIILRSVLDNSQEAIGLSKDGVNIIVNSAYLKMFGYSSLDEIIEVPIIELIAPKERNIVKEYIEKRAYGLYAPTEYFSKGLRKDGSVFDVEVRVITNKINNEIFTIAIHRDITETKMIEEDLRESREILSKFMDNSPISMIIKDDQLRFRYVNKTWEETTRKRFSEVKGKTNDDIFNPEEAAKLNEIDYKVINEARSIAYEDTLTFNNRINYFLIHKFPIMNSDGKPYLLGTGALNIQELKVKEIEIRQTHDVLMKILDGIDAMVYVADIETYEIIYVNEYFRNIFGEVKGKICWKVFFEGKSGPCDYCTKDKLLLPENNPSNDVIRWVYPKIIKGKHYEIRERAIRWIDGRIVRIEIATDITERKKAEQEMILSKESAEHANRIKDKFVALVAHDIIGPLGSISGMIDLLAEKTSNTLPNDLKRVIDASSKSLKRMQHMANDILSMTRFKGGMIKPRLRIVKVSYLLERLMGSFEHIARQKGVLLVNKISDAKDIFTDESLLEQIIGNLLSNAIKFSKDGNTVIIFNPDGKPNTIAVSDNGTGINPTFIDNLFDFDKKSTSTGTSGEIVNGLGLPLSKEIIHILDGNITFETEIGKGTIFYVNLPDLKPKIMIVDDEEIFRLEQSYHLRELDPEVIDATNGEDALAKLNHIKPNLIITDISMPIMNGLELLEKLKTNSETISIPVIVVTALTGRGIRDQAFKIGADDFVQKPLKPEEFIPRVRRFLV